MNGRACSSPAGIALLLIAICGTTWAARAQTAGEDAIQRMADTGNAAVVAIYSNRGKSDTYYGTGAVISADGYILTSTTVVLEDSREIEVYFTDYTKASARVVEVNREMETALIKAETNKNLTFFPAAEALPRVGEGAFTYGNAQNAIRLGGKATFSAGVISGIYRVASADGQSSYAGLALETDASINPGQDGGPIVNDRGELVGIISLSYTELRWQGTAVPLSLIRKALKSFQNGTVPLNNAAAGAVSVKVSDAQGWLSPGVSTAADALVALEVTREQPPEVLPRCSWAELLAQTAKMNGAQKARRMQDYGQAEIILSANRQIRRPNHPVTGLVISADGQILTSLFNVADDPLLRHKTQGLIKFDYRGNFAKDLFPYPAEEYENAANKVVSIQAVLKDGRRLPAKVVARHLPLGLALLQVEARNLPFLDVAARAKVPVTGSAVGVLGHVGGEHPYTLNTGMVSSTERVRGLQFQFDAILNYGNSGGPVIAPDGTFYGLALQPLAPGALSGRMLKLEELQAWSIAINSGVSFAARADEIVKALPTLAAGKNVEAYAGPYLGISPDPRKLLTDSAVIAIVAGKSPAQKAGLKPGDVVESMDGKPVTSWKQLVSLIMAHAVGETAVVRVMRGKETLEFNVVLEARP